MKSIQRLKAIKERNIKGFGNEAQGSIVRLISDILLIIDLSIFLTCHQGECLVTSRNAFYEKFFMKTCKNINSLLRFFLMMVK